MTDWADIENTGRRTGHILCSCPDCHALQLIPITEVKGRAKSAPNRPSTDRRCKVCGRIVYGKHGIIKQIVGPRLEVIGDPTLVTNRTPGKPRSPSQVRRDGGVVLTVNPVTGAPL